MKLASGLIKSRGKVNYLTLDSHKGCKSPRRLWAWTANTIVHFPIDVEDLREFCREVLEDLPPEKKG